MTDPPLIVRVTRQFAHAPERVFDAWLDPARAARFLFATSTGTMVRAEIDPRVGGTYSFVDRRDGVDVEHTGEYLEIARPRRLVFTFGVPAMSADFARVTIDIRPHGTGCELTLTQEMPPAYADYLERTRQGWETIVANLDKALG